MPRTLGVVLAGGQSRRMGTNKALLPLGSGTLLDHMREVLARGLGQKTSDILIAGAVPGYPESLPDVSVGLGPLSGLLEAACRARVDDLLVVVPVDMPRLTARLIGRLHRELEADETRVWTSFFGSALPVAMRQKSDWMGWVDQILNSRDPAEDRSLRRLFSTFPGKHVRLSERERAGLVNTNTPQEWKECIV